MVENKDRTNYDALRSSEEREIKLSVSERTFHTVLETLRPEAKDVIATQVTDTYYDDPAFSLTNLNRGLRLRTGSHIPTVLEFKSLFYIPSMRAKNPWLIEEQTFRLPIQTLEIAGLEGIFNRFKKSLIKKPGLTQYDKDDIDSLIKQSGLDARIVVAKDRTEVVNNQRTFSFDHIQGLGYFVEIETHDKSNPIDLIGTLSGLADYQIVREGYNDMVAQKYPEVVPAKQRQQRFVSTPSWNILPGEEDVIKALLHI